MYADMFWSVLLCVSRRCCPPGSSFAQSESIWVTYSEFWEYFDAVDVSLPSHASSIYLDSDVAGVCGPCGGGCAGIVRYCYNEDDPTVTNVRAVQPLPQKLSPAQSSEIDAVFLAEEVVI